jgi:hypothetical protein
VNNACLRINDYAQDYQKQYLVKPITPEAIKQKLAQLKESSYQ